MTPKQIFDSLVPILKHEACSVPKRQLNADYFPAYLKQCLDEYLEYFKAHIKPITNSVPFGGSHFALTMLDRIERLSSGLNDTVRLYYEGKTFKAAEAFETTLRDIYFNGIKDHFMIEEDRVFYRGRPGKDKPFSRSEMFHIPFELRHLASTNRYSIPGLPALYVGDSAFICWEELNRQRLRDIYFSKITNTTRLKVIRIQRFEDTISEIDKRQIGEDLALMFLLRQITLFPLIIACCICVKEVNAVFKPEYIIPQLLLQLISNDEELHIDGIMYTSTKIDYSKLINLPAYNYIFPVKKIAPKGFCSHLVSMFELTNSTSLELEEVMHNPMHHLMWTGPGHMPRQSIEVFEGVESHYYNTSFGKIEQYLSSRLTEKIPIA